MKNKLSILFLLFYTSLAFTSDLPAIKEPAQPADLESAINEKNDTSLNHRKDLKYQMSLAFIGMEYSGTAPLTLSTGLFLNETNQLLIRYSKYTGGYESRKLWILTLADRYYLGNSFNIMGSLYWGRDSAFDNINKATYTSKELGVGLRIGNEWQWKNFTMGCDWFGINHSLIKNQTKTLPTFSSTEDRPLSLNFTFISFYLGFSF